MSRSLTFVWNLGAMHGELGRLGAAQVRWNDYIGTAAADDADAILDTRSLYEIVGLDRDRWTIVGLDFLLASSADRGVVYAIDRRATSSDPIEGDLPVTAFHLGTSGRLDKFLREIFKRFSVRLLATAVQDRELVVVEHASLTDTSPRS